MNLKVDIDSDCAAFNEYQNWSNSCHLASSETNDRSRILLLLTDRGLPRLGNPCNHE